jgi:hypothetical protein
VLCFRECGFGLRYLLRRVSYPSPFSGHDPLSSPCCYLSLPVVFRFGWCWAVLRDFVVIPPVEFGGFG